MKVLVIGGGGREHAIVWKLSQSSRVSSIFCIPGNGGISEIATCINRDVNDIEALIDFSKKEKIDLVVVGPEGPLAAGIVDSFEEQDIPIFGPNRSGAQIEGSKIFTKNLLHKYNIPTAPFKTFSHHAEAKSYIDSKETPFVIKADGLCSGKGAYVLRDKVEAQAVLESLMVKTIYGSAGANTVVEDFLHGIEASYIAFTDGTTVLPLLPSQDHKPLLDGDKGPNTGGMGAYTPIPFINEELDAKILQSIMIPTVQALKSEGIHYKGALYGGLMLQGIDPYVIEFNARFGDPETQPLFFHMDSDLLSIILATVEGKLDTINSIQWKKGVSVCVVIASKGYPDSPEKGKIIKGLDQLKDNKNVKVFHAGTKREGNNIITSGGRVLGVTASGDSYKDAIRNVYDAVNCIEFEGMYFRKDIGQKAIPLKTCTGSGL